MQLHFVCARAKRTIGSVSLCVCGGEALPNTLGCSATPLWPHHNLARMGSVAAARQTCLRSARDLAPAGPLLIFELLKEERGQERGGEDCRVRSDGT